MTTSMSELKPLNVFCSYSHKDERLRQRLEIHLALLTRQGLIRDWHVRKLYAGQEWSGAISEHLDAADLILLLVSADFIASNYCWDKEVERALERHATRTARVIPIILRPCDWHEAPFGKLQALPTDAKPVTRWSDREEAWNDVVKGIRKLIQSTQLTPRAGAPSSRLSREIFGQRFDESLTEIEPPTPEVELNGFGVTSPPASPVFRLTSSMTDPFAPPAWERIDLVGSRFDDPRGAPGMTLEERFRVIYFATQRTATFGESLSRFRVSAALSELLVELGESEHVDSGVVPAEWWHSRCLASTRLNQSLYFVDLMSRWTLQALRIGIDAIYGTSRVLTQEIARHVYEQVDSDGKPLFAGIRYLSRINPEWELWAVFDNRLDHSPVGVPEPIRPNDPGLIEAARLLDLYIEASD